MSHINNQLGKIMKFNRLEIKLLAACVMYALSVGYAFADEWQGFLAGTASTTCNTHRRAT